MMGKRRSMCDRSDHLLLLALQCGWIRMRIGKQVQTDGVFW